jgi:transcriptional regulator with XRE-family HTH domain
MNRISASKLWKISQVLDVPVQWFFKEFAEPKDEEDKLKESFHMKRETLELVRNYVAAPADVQRKFLGLVKSIANSASS